MVLDEALRIITGFKEDTNLGKSQRAKTRVGHPGKGQRLQLAGVFPVLGARGCCRFLLILRLQWFPAFWNEVAFLGLF